VRYTYDVSEDSGGEPSPHAGRQPVTDAWSINDGYWDTDGDWHDTPEEAHHALLTAMGGTEGVAPPAALPLWIVRMGEQHDLLGPCRVILEDGTDIGTLVSLPPDLPVGYHDLRPEGDGPTTRLIVSPGHCRLPERSWGWAAQLYALRSRHSWGMGDLGDLRQLCEWSAGLGARVAMINPLHANAPTEHQQPSPYFATSRLYRNVLYLRIADIPGAAAWGSELARLDEAGRTLNEVDRIDRDAVFRLKQPALEQLYARFRDAGGHDAFDRWRHQEGPPLERFATWCALAERHGPVFREWPATLRHPDGAAVAAFVAEATDRVQFHAWCQWQVDLQLAAAGHAGVELVADVAVGFDPMGADGWAFQDVLAAGCRVGAPPDTFNTAGQDWGLPPFVPWKLRAAYYEPFAQTIRASFRHCGGVRIDHVMGLFRLYWVPPQGGPRDGAYVAYPGADLLDVVAVEAYKAGGFVVGEDLGTITEEAREALHERNILSYRLVWFEEGATTTLPERALAAVTTHDLGTIAGVWTGADLAVRRQLGLEPDEGPETDEPFHGRLIEVGGVEPDASVDDVVVAVHGALAEAPSLLLLATLDDCAATPHRPNLPGTIDEWPNWRIPLPLSLDELTASPLTRRVAAALDDGVRSGPPPPVSGAGDGGSGDPAIGGDGG
jgi:4-alpha-glucanotransferase